MLGAVAGNKKLLSAVHYEACQELNLEGNVCDQLWAICGILNSLVGHSRISK